MPASCPHEGCICQPLTTARRGVSLVVRHLVGSQNDRQRLLEMGFREQAYVSVVCAGGAVIAQVQGAKICLSRSMAESVLVTAA
jgi:Fe2+ transport system protein FeoA